MLVTRLGVSVLKVVATIEMPTSHHGAARPEVKNSVVLEPARRQKKRAGMNEMPMLAPMIDQSRVVKWKGISYGRFNKIEPRGRGERQSNHRGRRGTQRTTRSSHYCQPRGR